MAKLSRVVGSTSQIEEIFIADSASLLGAGKTGLAYNTASIVAYYKRNKGAASVAITLATIPTLGTFATGGLKEVDATNMPGVYEFHPPDIAFATGADSVVFMIQGAAGMAPCLLEIELTAWNNQDGVRGGLTSLPNGPQNIKKNQALAGFPFPMFNSSGSPLTGLTVTAQRMIDGGAFFSCANSVVEVTNGWYKIDLAAADLNGTTIGLKLTATGALDTDFTLVTQP